MPQLDGVTAVARLRRDHPTVRVIALTGDSDPGLHPAAVDVGADEVLLKSDIAGGLVSCLQAVC